LHCKVCSRELGDTAITLRKASISFRVTVLWATPVGRRQIELGLGGAGARRLAFSSSWMSFTSLGISAAPHVACASAYPGLLSASRKRRIDLWVFVGLGDMSRHCYRPVDCTQPTASGILRRPQLLSSPWRPSRRPSMWCAIARSAFLAIASRCTDALSPVWLGRRRILEFSPSSIVPSPYRAGRHRKTSPRSRGAWRGLQKRNRALHASGARHPRSHRLAQRPRNACLSPPASKAPLVSQRVMGFFF